MTDADRLLLAGEFTATVEVPPDELDLVRVEGWAVEQRGDGLLVAKLTNAFVDFGAGAALDRLFGLASPAVPSHIGLSSSTSAVTGATTTLGGTVSIKAFSPAASRAGRTVTAGATYTQADIAFVISKLGFLNTATDAGTGLFNVIGCSGAAPYNKPFTIDLVQTTSFSLLMQGQVTA